MGYSWSQWGEKELAEGRTIKVRPRGNSMTPRIKSGDLITLEPVTEETDICKISYLSLLAQFYFT